MLSEKQAQKEALRQKLNARKMLSEQKEYEMFTARMLMDQANENIRNLEKNVAQEMGKQSNMVGLLFLKNELFLIRLFWRNWKAA